MIDKSYTRSTLENTYLEGFMMSKRERKSPWITPKRKKRKSEEKRDFDAVWRQKLAVSDKGSWFDQSTHTKKTQRTCQELAPESY